VNSPTSVSPSPQDHTGLERVQQLLLQLVQSKGPHPIAEEPEPHRPDNRLDTTWQDHIVDRQDNGDTDGSLDKPQVVHVRASRLEVKKIRQM
jgi:hypothetical protein